MPALASSQAAASSHSDRVRYHSCGWTRSLWELATACDEAGTGLRRLQPHEHGLAYRPTAAAHRRRLNFSLTLSLRCCSGSSASRAIHWLRGNHRPWGTKRNTTSPGNAMLSRHSLTGCQPCARLNNCQPRGSRRSPVIALAWPSKMRRGMTQQAWARQPASSNRRSQPGTAISRRVAQAASKAAK